jgi:hypothetical protein
MKMKCRKLSPTTANKYTTTGNRKGTGVWIELISTNQTSKLLEPIL